MNPARSGRRGLLMAIFSCVAIASCWWWTRPTGLEMEVVRPLRAGGGEAPARGGAMAMRPAGHGPEDSPEDGVGAGDLHQTRTTLRSEAGRPLTYTLRGTVRASDGGDLDALNLRLRTAFDEYRTVRVEHDGSFAIPDLGAGSYRMRAEFEGYYDLYQRLDVTSDPATHRVDFQLVAIPRIRVRVAYPEGQQLTDWVPTARKIRSFEILATRTPLPAYLTRRTQRLGALGRVDWDADHEGVLELEEATSVYLNVILDQAVLKTRFVPLGTEEITFEMDEAAAAAGCGNVMARFVRRADGAAVRGKVSIGAGRTYGLKDGALLIPKLPAGKHRLRVSSADCAEWTRKVDVRPGLDVDLGTIVLEPGPRILGSVQGSKARRTLIDVAPVLGDPRDAIWPRSSAARADQDGKFTVRGRASGLYLVRARASTSFKSAAVLVDTRAGEDQEVLLSLVRTTRVGVPGREAWKGLKRYTLTRPGGQPYARGVLRRGATDLQLLPGKSELTLTTADGQVGARALVEIGGAELDLEADAFARLKTGSER